MNRIDRTFNVEDVRKIAKRRLPRAVFEIIEGGAGDESSLAANRDDLNELRLLPRSLEDVSGVDTTTTVLGQKMSMPVLLAPCSFGGIRRGIDVVRALSLQEPVQIGAVRVCPGDIIVADDTGVVCVPQGRYREVLDLAQQITSTEQQQLAKIGADQIPDWDAV